jgi:hypothetical protein
MQFSSKDHQKRAMAFGRLARMATLPETKDRLQKSQQKFEALARQAQKQEAKSSQTKA